MKPIKNSNKLSTENLKWNYSYIKDLSLAIKSDPTSKIYKIERGFFYLKRKKYLRAIDDFSTVIRIYDFDTNRLQIASIYFHLNQNQLNHIYLFRGFAYALYGDRENSSKDLNHLLGSDSGMKFVSFLLFTWFVLDSDTERAIRRYSQLRSYAKELMGFEEDLFILLPINKIEGLNESIKLLDLSLGIIRKNRN